MKIPFFKQISLGSIFISLFLLGAGCFGGTSATPPAGPDLGIWKTSDGGASWVHKLALVDGPKVTADAANLNVQAISFDPQDRLAVYAGTVENGLAYSYNGGDSWQIFKSLEAKNVKNIVVDSKNKCTIYASSDNKIYKTTDCGRDWEIVFFDPRTDKVYTALIADWFNPTILYAGTNDGDILKSIDEGKSWQVVKRANAGITSLVLGAQDSRMIFAGTDGDGIWKSFDGGVTWIQIKNEFGDIGGRRVVKIIPDRVDPNLIYLLYKGGIAKTADQGQTWVNLNLFGNAGENAVADLDIDPNNPKHLVYTGPTALVFSNDAGQTWEAKKLPTANFGTVVKFDPKDGNIVYLGIVKNPRAR